MFLFSSIRVVVRKALGLHWAFFSRKDFTDKHQGLEHVRIRGIQNTNKKIVWISLQAYPYPIPFGYIKSHINFQNTTCFRRVAQRYAFSDLRIQRSFKICKGKVFEIAFYFQHFKIFVLPKSNLQVQMLRSRCFFRHQDRPIQLSMSYTSFVII